MFKSKLPKDFNLYYKPVPPLKPIEFLPKSETIKTISIGVYDSMDYEDLPKCDQLSFEVQFDRCDGSPDKIIIRCIKKLDDVPNVNYKKEMKRYEEMRKKYLINLKEWNKNKKIYDEEKKMKELEVKKQLFEELKKELGE